MQQRIELVPNCSLSVAGARLFFAATCLFSLSFALFFVLQGFWPVLLFWAIEMLALGIALHASMQRRNYTQTVLISDSWIHLVTRSRHGEAKQEFARHWAKVRLRSPPRRLGTSRLTNESHFRHRSQHFSAAKADFGRRALPGRSRIGRQRRRQHLERLQLADGCDR